MSAVPKRLAVPAGAVVLCTVVAASVALATTPTPRHHARRTTAARTTAIPPNYTLPIGTLIADGKVGKPSLSGDNGTAGVPVNTPKPKVNPAQVPANTASIQTYRGGSGTLTPAGIATLALQAGCSSKNAVIATAVSMAESGGSPSAQGDIALMDSTWDWSAGLWQIRGLRSERNTGQLRDSVANQSATKNAAAMYIISSGCTSWGPWTTYTRGIYRQYLLVATQAVNYVVRYFDAHGHHYPTVAPPDPNAPIPSGGSDGDGDAQAAGPAPASSAHHTTHSSSKTHASADHSTAAAQPAGGGAKAGGSGGGGGAKASPTPAKSAAGGVVSKVTNPVKGATSAVGSILKSALPTCTPLLPIGTKCKPKS